MVLPSRVYRTEFARRGLAPRMLSRTVEDTGTVTSPLVPWNSCGAYMTGVLGVPTIEYLPFAFFNLLNPLVALAYAFTGFRIEHLDPAEAPAIDGERRQPTASQRPPKKETLMSTDTETAGDAEPAGEEPEPRKPRFALPSAYTILFALIVITALATWIIPAGQYALDADGSPIPGTYEEVESTPSRIIVDSLEAPINGLYGIEDPATGNVDVFNSGELFGAIDVALFILVIGGFIGITMKTGAIQAGIALLVARLRGHERWMIPILMTVFAIGGTTFGMAEESLAFYVLDHHRDDRRRLRRPRRRAGDPARLWHRRARLDRQPVRHRHRLRLRRRPPQRRPRTATRHPHRRPGRRHLVRAPLRRAGAARPVHLARVRHEGGQRTPLRRDDRRRHR